VATSSNLQVSVEQAGELERRMTVKVPAAVIEREIDQRLRKIGRTAKLRGFRPGKIPAKVVKQRFGGQVRQEVLSDVIRSSFSQAVSQEQLMPAGGPAIEPLGGADEGHFSYRATFEVYPTIELQGVESLAIELPEVTIGDEDVDAMIENLRRQRAEWRTVERQAAAGDRIVIDFQGKVNKQPFEGGEGKEVAITVGEGQVIEDFDKALTGLAAGEDKTAKVKFPKDYPTDTLAGKKAVFDIHVHRVEEQILPELDEAFFEAFGISEGGLEALKTEVQANMQRELDERLRAERKSRTLDAFLKSNQISVPNSLVKDEIDRLQAETMRQLHVEDPAQAPARENFQDMAEERVALGLLVQELIRKQDIALDRTRVDARINELAAPYEQPAEAAKLYRSSRELMTQIESKVLEDQVVDFLIERATITQKPMTFDEFMNI
jgi:trigger factor